MTKHKTATTPSPPPKPPTDNPHVTKHHRASADKRDGSDDADGGDAPRRLCTDHIPEPRTPRPVPADAVWLTSVQTCARYGGRSQMWLWRKINRDAAFPKPAYLGRMMMFSRAELDAYDTTLIQKRSA